MKYQLGGQRTERITSEVEPELKLFLEDYAAALGLSHTAAIRRLILLGAQYEMASGGKIVKIAKPKDPNEIIADVDHWG